MHPGQLRIEQLRVFFLFSSKAFTSSLQAIIDPEMFEMVQRELARRTKGKNRHSGVHLLSGRI